MRGVVVDLLGIPFLPRHQSAHTLCQAAPHAERFKVNDPCPPQPMTLQPENIKSEPVGVTFYGRGVPKSAKNRPLDYFGGVFVVMVYRGRKKGIKTAIKSLLFLKVRFFVS